MQFHELCPKGFLTAYALVTFHMSFRRAKSFTKRGITCAFCAPADTSVGKRLRCFLQQQSLVQQSFKTSLRIRRLTYAIIALSMVFWPAMRVEECECTANLLPTDESAGTHGCRALISDPVGCFDGRVPITHSFLCALFLLSRRFLRLFFPLSVRTSLHPQVVGSVPV